MIKALALFNRKVGWSNAEFMCHYKERHAPLVAGTAGFTRHCLRYIQNYPENGFADLRWPLLPRDAISEMWFADMHEMDATYQAPDYLERARPDEHRFADFGSASVYVCEEHELFRQDQAVDPDMQWTNLPLFRLFVFRSHTSHDDIAAWQLQQLDNAMHWQQDNVFTQLVRRHVQSHRIFFNAADLPIQSDDLTALIDEFSFDTLRETLAFTEHRMNSGRLNGTVSPQQQLPQDVTLFLSSSHMVFSTE